MSIYYPAPYSSELFARFLLFARFFAVCSMLTKRDLVIATTYKVPAAKKGYLKNDFAKRVENAPDELPS